MNHFVNIIGDFHPNCVLNSDIAFAFLTQKSMSNYITFGKQKKLRNGSGKQEKLRGGYMLS